MTEKTASSGLRRSLAHVAITTILAAVLCLLVVRLWFRPTPGGTTPAADRRETVVKRGSVRAGYYAGAPYFIKDAKGGNISGIFAEVFEEACGNLGLKVEWTEEVGFGQMIEGLETGRYDVVASGIWINASRARGADFSTPILYDAVCVFAREGDRRFDSNLAALNDPAVKISTIDGEMASLVAKTDFPKAQVVSLPQSTDFTQMILNVVNNKADVTILGVGPAAKFQAANPGAIRNITPDRPVRVFPTAVMVKRGEYEFKRMLDLSLTEMINNGRVEAIIRKYEEHPGSHYRVAPGYTLPAPKGTP
jgi:ABC-type amino acid transport substrate-binding protein